MFTGLVEATGTILKVTGSDVLTLSIESHFSHELKVGESIAINGACLTVVSFNDASFDVNVITGTKNVTTLANLRPKDIVNLERAMKKESRFGGHFVSGHVDSVGYVTQIIKKSDEWVVSIHPPNNIMNQIVSRGSITVDGVSLTVFDVQNEIFKVHLIPETRRKTTLHTLNVGDEVHLETDVLFKYVEKAVSNAYINQSLHPKFSGL